jgi:hypothetical protein
MILIHSLAWIPMVFIAIVNGIAREKGYGRHMSELRAHQVSTLTGIAVFTIYAWALGRIWPLASAVQALAVGGIWLALTVAFEFLFGRLVRRLSWRLLAGDYNLLRGRVWPVFLLWLAALPCLVFRFHS